MKKSQLNESDIHYLEQWVQQDMFTDYDLFFDRGFYELCAIRLSDSGAIEGNNNKNEININNVAKSISFEEERKMVEEAATGVRIFVCDSCNTTCFIPEESTYSAEELMNDGCPQACGNTLKEEIY